MTAGKLRTKWDGGDAEAEIDSAGVWRSPSDALAETLNALHPPPSTTVGFGWAKAFWRAISDLGAQVVTEPVADTDPKAIY